MFKCKARKYYDWHPRLPIFEFCVYNRCLNLSMVQGPSPSPSPRWPWSFALVKMASKARSSSCMHSYAKYAKFSLWKDWQNKSRPTSWLFRSFYAEVVSVYPRTLSVYTTAHCPWWNKWNKQIGNICNYIYIHWVLTGCYLLCYVMEIVLHHYIFTQAEPDVYYISFPTLNFIFKLW